MLQFLIDNYNGDIKDIINQKDRDGEDTPLDLAYMYNDSPIKKDIVALLRQYGGKANCHDNNGTVGKDKGDLNGRHLCVLVRRVTERLKLCLCC